MNRRLKLFLVVAILVVIGGGLWAYWRFSTLYPSTDDAYLRANIVNVTAEVTGKVVAVHVKDNQFVQAGDALFEIDPTVYRNAVAEARSQVKSALDSASAFNRQVDAATAAVSSAEAAKKTADAQFERVQALNDHGDAPRSSLDQASAAAAQAAATLNAATAQLAQAEAAASSNRNLIISGHAQLDTAEANLEHATVTAPVDGWVANVDIREGSSVVAYTPLFALVDSSSWWVDANFKETDLSRIRQGQPAKITVDFLPGVTLTGKVGSIARGSGATFALLPAENASGNWVKVTQRFAVRIPIDPTKADLRVGASATVRVDTTGDGK